jgi:LPS O-antigen subunit length determinant protein (WzzB/FepE family)
MENKNQNHIIFDDEYSLNEIFSAILKRKILILLVSISAALGSVFYALSLSDIYTSSATLSPVNNSGSMSSMLGPYSSLAGLAGINVGGNSSKSEEAIERIKSLDFFSNHFIPNIKLEDLSAVEDWDSENNSVIYNEKVFNETEKKWIRKVSFPLKTVPSNQEAYEEYQKILSIYESKKTGFIVISVSHPSPYIAKEWTDIIIYNINESMREIDKEESLNSIDFVTKLMETTKLSEIRDALARLVENQMQTLMMASASEGYVFNVINAPVVQEKKSAPSRALICILGTLFGLVIGIFISLFLHFFRKEKH